MGVALIFVRYVKKIINMQIDNIKLKNFRNHTSLDLSFEPKLTLIQGLNGAGKSNILEAIQVISTGKSQRARYDRDMIMYEHDFCTIQASTTAAEQNYQLDVQIIRSQDIDNNSTKKAKVNKVVKPVTHLIGLLNTVSFAPHDIEIIIGSPSERRRFMDFILIQTNQSYKKAITQYTKALRQRNKLLEMINETGIGYEQIGYWTDQLLQSGTLIQNKRENLIHQINTVAGVNIKKLDHEDTDLKIIYDQNEINPERLEKHKQHEIAAKTTLVGPHRDDFTVLYKGHNLAEFGSRGQQRTVLLAIKLAEVEYFLKDTGESPVLLLDDIFSELDEHHRNTVMETVTKQQTIITFADKPAFIHLNGYKMLEL
jgi:DNA replication and repair protein RecF